MTTYNRVHGVIFLHLSIKIAFSLFGLNKEFVLHFFGFFGDNIGGTLVNVFMKPYFDVFRQSSVFDLYKTFLDKVKFLIYSLKTELILYIFGGGEVTHLISQISRNSRNS